MVDKQKALDDFQITEKEYDEMLVEFVAQADEKISRITLELAAGKVHEAAFHAHSLKGVAGNLRLDDCYSAASKADAFLKNAASVPGDLNLADLKNAVDEGRKSITCHT
jgi:HPt (histidine-containing phosphotransfer) domain-containing protein